MSLQISERHSRAGLLCIALLSLAACSGGSQEAAKATTECIIGDSKTSEWDRACRVERSGERLTVRHPDGGFRRFHVETDGRGLTSADGAEPVELTILSDNLIEVAVGDDRYKLPAVMADKTP